MNVIGAYEAKTHLPQLLARVAKGERIIITKHGKPIAVLVPPDVHSQKQVHQAVQEMLAWRDRSGPTLAGKASLRDLIDQGRRF